MTTLTLRIYLTLVAVLAFFAFGSGWLFQHRLEEERTRADTVLSDRMAAWGDLIERSLPGPATPASEQAAAVNEWSMRLRLPLALDDAHGTRIAASELFLRRQEGNPGRASPIRLDDGRTLWVMRPGRMGPRADRPGGPGAERVFGPPWPFVPAGWQRGMGHVVLLVAHFVAVAIGAWPVVRHLTRRLQALKRGMEVFGAGRLDHRVEVSGRDELAAVAASFNQAAERIEALVRSHQSLLANASHELRSPLARLKMAVSMLAEASPEQRDHLRREIDTDIGELDALVEEVLLASRLDALRQLDQREPVDLLGLAAEEAARVDAVLEPTHDGSLQAQGDERLLRRALRNLLENARRYGGDDVSLSAHSDGDRILLRVCDRGPGVPADQRERIFEPFYRLPGHAEKAGGVGLGLSLVKQIAERHSGDVRCEPREGGGSCFVLALPVAR